MLRRPPWFLNAVLAEPAELKMLMQKFICHEHRGTPELIGSSPCRGKRTPATRPLEKRCSATTIA